MYKYIVDYEQKGRLPSKKTKRQRNPSSSLNNPPSDEKRLSEKADA